MRCLYREKKYICGDYLEVDIYPVYKYQRSRSKKAKPTSEVQKKLNQRNAERKLIRLLNTNFTEHDIRFDLTYDKDHCPSSPEEAQKECQKFLRRVKYARSKSGLPALKYVFVTEVGKRSGRLHHHIVMSGGMDINELADIWGRGYTSAKPLQFNEQGITGIAMYLVKEPILGKRWCASRNLSKPVESERTGRLPQYQVREWNNSGMDNKAEIERTYEGFTLTDIKPFYNQVNGGYYVTLRLQRQKQKPKQKRSVHKQ